jgi:hypothetical protein
MRTRSSRCGRGRARGFCSLAVVLLVLVLVSGCKSYEGAGSAGSGNSGGPHVGGGAPSSTVPGPGASPTTTVPPEPHGTTRDAYRDIAERELSEGTIAYNPPSQMNLEESVQVEARITRAARLEPDFTSNFPGTAPTRVERLPVGTFMKATLQGPSMKVTTVGEDVKRLGSESYVSWLWHVEPTRTGTQYLYLTVDVLYEGTSLSERRWTRRIEVRVGRMRSLTHWFGQNWGELLSLVVASGAFGWLIAFLRRRLAARSSGGSPDQRSRRVGGPPPRGGAR